MRLLVVGGSSGIGRGVTRTAAERGATVAVAARRRDQLLATCEGLGERARPITCDVRRESDCERAVLAAADALGGLDAFVYCAGTSPLAALREVDGDTWTRVLETNLVGASLICRAALPYLLESRGRAVFLGSSSAGNPIPGLVPYAASKAALDELVTGWRTEHPEILFTNVAVGPTVETDFATAWDPELTGRMFDEWARRGFLRNEPSMSLADCVEAILHVLTAPVAVWRTSIYGHPPKV
jgi:NAD(P)-dependent dehydrogenase (short-subunit alcohol dehydrogenase family)